MHLSWSLGVSHLLGITMHCNVSKDINHVLSQRLYVLSPHKVYTTRHVAALTLASLIFTPAQCQITPPTHSSQRNSPARITGQSPLFSVFPGSPLEGHGLLMAERIGILQRHRHIYIYIRPFESLVYKQVPSKQKNRWPAFVNYALAVWLPRPSRHQEDETGARAHPAPLEPLQGGYTD